jgi:hypothetical protein
MSVILKWDGQRLPDEMRSLPAGRYVVQPARDAVPALQESWREPSIDDLIVDQGVPIPQRLESLLGAGADLWEDDSRLDRFIADIYGRRRETLGRDEAPT